MSLTPVTVPGGFDLDDDWTHSLWLRPWDGHDEEAFLDRPSPSVASQTTALLSRCVFLDPDGTPASSDFLRKLQVGDREALLLSLRHLTVGDSLSCVLDCGACGNVLELELTTQQLRVPPYAHRGWTHDAQLSDGERPVTVRFRLPNGGDQETMAALVADPARAAAALVQRCVSEASPFAARDLNEQHVAELSRTMASLDPQAEIVLRTTCPHCGEALSSLFDAARFLSAEISGSSEQLHREVHVLAYHYHWSAAEILGMSGRRRRTYIRHLADALSERRVS
ncbi:MAG: hypothetical protein P8188_14900 [Gemmatimonadota bacterium]|jgi:hypothetical protein